MSIGGIGGQSGFYPAEAAAQYYKNAIGGVKDSGKFSQARQQAEAEKIGVAERNPLGAIPSGDISKGGEKKSATTEESSTESSTNSLAYDPRDTNRDGQVSLQEELAYAAKQYSAASAGGRRVGNKSNSPSNNINSPKPQSTSINMLV